MDAAVFRQLAADVARAGNRVTLYASSNDEVLKASMRLHAFPRAGLSGDGLVVVPGVETVDVSAVDSSLLGHRYYRDSGSIVGDLYTVLRNWLPAAQRRHLRALGEGARQFWQLIVGPG
jgi:esterase/lipase superfamily enzyme